MAAKEIYANPPVALALVEIKHPANEQLNAAALGLLKQALADQLPIQRSEDVLNINVQTGERLSTRSTRFVARDLHTSVSFRDDAIIFETTSYQGWPSLTAVLDAALRARLDIGPVDGLERIGLRYVNEIRAPDPDPRWRDWVRDGLVGPVPKESGLHLTLRERQGLSAFDTERENETVTLRYTSGTGEAVISTPNLTRPTEQEGKYFLLDIDSVWLPGRSGIPEFDLNLLGEILDRLHKSAKDLFEFCISDRLREEVLSK